LKEVGKDGVLLEAARGNRYALMPLDDEMIDYLLERSPKFRRDCQRIRKKMAAGRFMTHEQVKKKLRIS
jgi:hypothetical protein